MSILSRRKVDQDYTTDYGCFSDDGLEYVITRYDTPRPWINVLCNREPGYGMVISQTGGGYSWLINAELNRITRWEQDLIQDNRGKYIYVRDNRTGEFWSSTFKPVGRVPENYECRHGIGYSVISSLNSGIRTSTTCFVPPGDSIEVWMLEIENLSGRSRSLSLISYLEWCLGTPDNHREFHRTFIETQLRPESGVMLARKRLWAIGNDKGQGWNRDWEYTAFHGCSLYVSAYEGDKEAFVGMYRGLENPAAVASGQLPGTSGKWGDGIAGLKVDVELPPEGRTVVVFTIGAADDDETAVALHNKYASAMAASHALDATRQWWRDQLSGFEVDTPDRGLNLMLNNWLRYQAMAGRIWGRSAYYQMGGAYGFRDQLQDSQVFLPTRPELTRNQILLHAKHQFAAGNVLHWWQPITENGAYSKFSDDLLWLPFVLINYLRETGDHAILDEPVPYVDGEAESLLNHCFRAIDLSLSRFSPRGLPLIGEGDWNDGLSAVGWDGKGESVWVGHFLCYLLPEWSALARRAGDNDRADEYARRQRELQVKINDVAWDGEWYVRATCDDGTVIGSRECAEGRIFLNAQTWSVISGTCPETRRAELMEVTRRLLYSQAGPVLLRPAYTKPDPRIGYLTRYAPAARENGGVYVHAATWAIWAECLLGRADMAWEIYTRISPIERGLDPDNYRAEPYVTAGNIDGPDSPNYGRGGWTWYTGSAGWLFRVMSEWVLGVRPEENGLRVDPRMPEGWQGFKMKRRFRGCDYEIIVRRADGALNGVMLTVDGDAVDGAVIPAFTDGGEHVVEVLVG